VEGQRRSGGTGAYFKDTFSPPDIGKKEKNRSEKKKDRERLYFESSGLPDEAVFNQKRREDCISCNDPQGRGGAGKENEGSKY